MRRGLLILLSLLAATWFEFEIFPGHTYLQGETQLLVPMLERLDTPGFLSRDLVASNPTFAYTIYDEITGALHSAGHLSFERAVLGQQILFRFAAMLGLYLLARALRVKPFSCVALAAAINAVSVLTAPASFVTSPEATPAAFAFSLILLAAGFFANRQPLAASLAAGVGMLYDPMIAYPFWLVVLIAAATDRSLRKPLKPAWPVLVVFALLLANLVQLQIGVGSQLGLTGRFSDNVAALTRTRIPWVWVTSWWLSEIWSYLFLGVAGIWAMARLWKQVSRATGWMLIGLGASGVAGAIAAMPLLAARFQFALAMPPAQTLAFTVALSLVACGAAGFHAAQASKWRESLCWTGLLLAAILNAQVVDLLHLKTALPLRPDTAALRDVQALAAWADRDTWGSSMFQFPDANRQIDPGIFRALSRRALWADWNSGLITATSEQAGQEWWSRWQDTETSRYSPARFQTLLHLPIDYYVLRENHRLGDIKPAYFNSTYVVYDAQDLREARSPITSGIAPR